MYSDELRFLEFLNYLVQLDGNKYYNDISLVSASNRGDPSTALIHSNKKILNFEDLTLNYYGKNNHPSIVDGLYFNFNKNNELSLFFIEFKGDKLNRKTWKNYFKENILSLIDNTCDNQHEDCPINKLDCDSLKKIYQQYADEILVQLKMKPLESILIAIPTLFKCFCDSDSNDNYILNNYFKCYVYVVYVGDGKNPANSQLTTKDIKNKYSLFKNNGLIYYYDVLTKKAFNEDMIPKIERFPIHFLNNILDIIHDFEGTENSSNFKNEIVKRLDDELLNESLNISNNQKRRLVEVICKYCSYNPC